MKKSKFIFFAVAAAVALLLILGFVIFGDASPDVPATSTVPTTGERPSSGTSDPTGSTPLQTTFPGWENVTFPDPFGPNGPIIEGPTAPPQNPDEPYYMQGTPAELTAADLPPSNGKHYRNNNPIGVSITRNGQTYSISFGINQEGLSEYIYLNPQVEYFSNKPNYYADYFQFCFVPSAGYVTTISSAEYGEYPAYQCNSTFVRAFDYALPSDYISETEPGTVWYVDNSQDPFEGPFHCCHIDVRIYSNGNLFASLRLLLLKESNGVYSLFMVMNLDQSGELQDPFGLVPQMPDSQMKDLIAQMKQDAVLHKDLFPISDEKLNNLTLEDLIIEHRPAGKGTYFDYYSDPTTWELLPRENLAGKDLIAISVRLASQYGPRGPATYYYVAEQNKAGETVFTLVGADRVIHYYRQSLFYSKYPGYCKDDIM